VALPGSPAPVLPDAWNAI